MNDRVTRWRNHGLAIWNYRLCDGETAEKEFQCPLTPRARALWIALRTHRLLSTLHPFAHAQKASISTQSGGEDAVVVQLKTAQATEKLLKRLRCTYDVIASDISLALDCLETDALGERRKLTIEGGGTLIMSIDLDEQGNLDMTFEDAISLAFFLHVDIYSPLTYGQIRENRELAAWNGPLLSNFLKRLEREIPATFDGVDAADYKGLVGRYGFIPPDDDVKLRHHTSLPKDL